MDDILFPPVKDLRTVRKPKGTGQYKKQQHQKIMHIMQECFTNTSCNNVSVDSKEQQKRYEDRCKRRQRQREKASLNRKSHAKRGLRAEQRLLNAPDCQN
jgi:hypothetical protein